MIILVCYLRTAAGQGCQAGLYLDAGKCVPCVSPCAKCVALKICSECIPRHFQFSIDNFCYPCIQNCNKCSDAARCNQCLTGYYVVPIILTCNKCNTNCYNCNANNCLRCNPGFQLTSSYQCLRCTEDVARCNICSCQDCGLTVDKSVCRVCDQCCTLNKITKQCLYAQQSCPQQLFIDMFLCYACQDNCIQCSSQTVCLTCSKNTYLIQSKCYFGCLPGYYLDRVANLCFKCFWTCKTCFDSNSFSCISCITDYFLTQAKSCQICSIGYSYIATGSTMTCYKICPAGFFTNGIQCKRCSQNCAKCRDQTTATCSACLNFYFLNLQTSICDRCAVGCQVCTSLRSCQQCDFHFYKDFLGKCIKQCPDNTLGFYKTRVCQLLDGFKADKLYTAQYIQLYQLSSRTIILLGMQNQYPEMLLKQIPLDMLAVSIQFSNQTYRFPNASKVLIDNQIFIFQYNISNFTENVFARVNVSLFRVDFFPSQVQFSSTSSALPISYNLTFYSQGFFEKNWYAETLLASLAGVIVWIIGLLAFGIGSDDTGLLEFSLKIHVLGMLNLHKTFRLANIYLGWKTSFLSLVSIAPSFQQMRHLEGNYFLVDSSGSIISLLGISYAFFAFFIIIMILNQLLFRAGISKFSSVELCCLTGVDPPVLALQRFNRTQNLMVLAKRGFCFIFNSIKLALLVYSIINIGITRYNLSNFYFNFSLALALLFLIVLVCDNLLNLFLKRKMQRFVMFNDSVQQLILLLFTTLLFTHQASLSQSALYLGCVVPLWRSAQLYLAYYRHYNLITKILYLVTSILEVLTLLVLSAATNSENQVQVFISLMVLYTCLRGGCGVGVWLQRMRLEQSRLRSQQLKRLQKMVLSAQRL